MRRGSWNTTPPLPYLLPILEKRRNGGGTGRPTPPPHMMIVYCYGPDEKKQEGGAGLQPLLPQSVSTLCERGRHRGWGIEGPPLYIEYPDFLEIPDFYLD